MNPFFLLLTLLSFSSLSFSQKKELNPGTDRWAIKTSLMPNPAKKSSSLDNLLSLPFPVDKYVKKDQDSARIPKTVGGLTEGNLVTITGWLKLVALEDASDTHADGDYHIQIFRTADSKDTCLVVEVPLPDFISAPDLKDQCAKVRSWVKSKLLNNKEPGTAGNIMTHPVYVTITGQLFFDAPHVNGKPRGKQGMKSYTPWELHPVVAMDFAPKPSKSM